MDIKYFTICEWVDRDLMHLERINTKLNMSDHLTKGLTHALSYSRAIPLTRGLPSQTHPSNLLTRLPIQYWDLHGFFPGGRRLCPGLLHYSYMRQSSMDTCPYQK